MPAAFLFDMDGTMVDNMAYHASAWLALLSEQGIVISREELIQEQGGHTTATLLPRLLGRPVPDAELARLEERKESLYRSLYGPHLKAIEGLEGFLGRARRMTIPMAVATSAGGDNIRFTLGGLGLEGFFETVVGSDEVPQGKAGPDMFLLAAKRLGVRAQDCLVFEDSAAGITAASLGAMQAVVVATEPDSERLLRLPAVLGLIQDYVDLDPARLLTDPRSALAGQIHVRPANGRAQSLEEGPDG